MTAEAQEQYVEFGIAKEKYAIKISEIQEIIKMQEITDVPNCKNYVKGVINLRGKVVPVISLRQLFRLPVEAYGKSTRIIVVNHRDESVGIIVEQVHKVNTFSDIQPPPERFSSVNGANFAGIGMSGDGLVGILRLDQVLIGEQDEA